MFSQIILLLSVIIVLSSAVIYKNFCEWSASAIQCKVKNSQYLLPQNENCDPFSQKGCEINDLIDNKIASCKPYLDGYMNNPDLRCFPQIAGPTNVYMQRIIGTSEGNPSCLPVKYKMKLICGERGTRCVCDTGDFKKTLPVNRWFQHQCRCQWFIDYCSISGVCSNDSKCITTGSYVLCAGGTVNQCTIKPDLCESINSYCVELDDKAETKWDVGPGNEGNGFLCIDKLLFENLNREAPYCNLNMTNIVLQGVGFRVPLDGPDYCCYAHLVCVKKGDKLGGFLLKPRPCYCLSEFKKCLSSIRSNNRLKNLADSLITVLSKILDCTFDDTGKCNPKVQSSCEKGDLIDPKIAHCKINCLTGPMLPIEIRSCRIRRCTPPNNLNGARVIDVPFYLESSRCDFVENLPIECGYENTRCVCDGLPPGTAFTDGCRCQYWPP